MGIEKRGLNVPDPEVKFSVVIPLYNRPQEIYELLDSLTHQQYPHFEVLVIEDGSQRDARAIVESFMDRLDVSYYFKPNEGQGIARNFGFERAKGDFFIVFDSDCIIPPGYFEAVLDYMHDHHVDAFGGPDAAHGHFTPIQKAISHSMTSFLTTGGIRGKKNHVGTYHPRGFNMGISRETFERTGGFRWTNFSEDMELSLRMHQMNLNVVLIPEAFVYHKRRTSFGQFFKQTHSFGKGRIRIFKELGSDLKLVHFFPAAFTLYVVGLLVIGLLFLYMVFNPKINVSGQEMGLVFLGISWPLWLYLIALWIDGMIATRSTYVGTLSVFSAFIQHVAYGSGFILDFVRKIIFRKET